jgi:hypothetical protein
MTEIINTKILNKELLKHKLILFYIYDASINYINIDNLINKENFNQNVKVFKINSIYKDLLNILDITTFPIIKLYKNKNNLEIFCNNKNIDLIINKILNY